MSSEGKAEELWRHYGKFGFEEPTIGPSERGLFIPGITLDEAQEFLGNAIKLVAALGAITRGSEKECDEFLTKAKALKATVPDRR